MLRQHHEGSKVLAWYSTIDIVETYFREVRALTSVRGMSTYDYRSAEVKYETTGAAHW